MYKKIFELTLCLAVLFVVTIGCSSTQSTTSPPTQTDPALPVMNPDNLNSGHNLLGNYSVKFDLEKLIAIVESNRENMFHFNVRSMIPAPIIAINGYDPVEEIIDVDVTISNPFLIDGYDLRVIIYTDGIGHLLKNPDHWTELYDISGGFNINPFKAYATQTPQRIFEGSTQHTENLLIGLPGGNPFVQFAIDVSYPGNCDEPYDIFDFQHDPLYNEQDDKANMAINISRWNELSTATVEFNCSGVMGATVLEMDTLDNELFRGEITNSEDASIGVYNGMIKAKTSDSTVYLYEPVNVTVSQRINNGWARQFSDGSMIGVEIDTSENIYSCNSNEGLLVKHDLDGNYIWTRDLAVEDGFSNVYDLKNNGFDDFMLIAGASKFCVTIDPKGLLAGKFKPVNQEDWVGDFCLAEPSWGTAILGDNNNNTYFTGAYVDGPGGTDSVMAKFDATGNPVWFNEFVNTDGSTNFTDLAWGNSFVGFYGIGSFWGTSVDFDPSGGTLIKSPYGTRDAFIAKYNSNGIITVLKNWGDDGTGNASVQPEAIASDSSDMLYIVGDFSAQVDFDPERTGQVLTSNGSSDIFLLKLNQQGIYQNAVNIGNSTDLDYGTDVAVDSNDDVYITGFFEQTVDFDPGASEALRTSNGSQDIYLVKFNSDLEFIWVQTWGGAGQDTGRSVICTPTDDYVILVGSFKETVDFDPGDLVFEMTATNHDGEGFLMRLNSNGLWEL